MSKGIMVLKSLSGMDYIGNIVDSSPTDFVIEDMYAVMVTHNQRTAEYDVSLGSPIHPSIGVTNTSKHGCVDKVVVSRSTTIFCTRPNEQLLERYRSTIDGIQIMKKMPGNM